MATAAQPSRSTSERKKTDPETWVNDFRAASDGNPTIGAMSRYFTCTYLLDMEERKALVEMDDGKVKRLEMDPGGLEAYDFAIRASAETWRKFSLKAPPPMFHGIWAATFREDMKLEGNLTVLMQNLRNLTVQLELPRETGVPV
jgi:hypothetical protein